MSKLIDTLKSGKILIGDGAMGTSLQKAGMVPGECPELWNNTHHDEVLAIIKAYVDAGCDMVETNSFGGTSFKLKHYDLADRVAEINKAAAAVAVEASGGKSFVAGSVGPTGEFMAPLGMVTEEEMYEAFKQQVVALAEGGADAICIETMTALEEAKVALKAAKENTNLPVITTFSFDKTVKGEYRTMMGVSPTMVAEEMTAAGADIIGSNCGTGPEDQIKICEELRSKTDCLILIQSNAGMPVLEDGQTVFKLSAEEMAASVAQLIKAGANIIGGCCGTTAAHLGAMKKALLEIQNG